MASPIPPILSALILEGLRKAGYSNPSPELQSRAQNRWLEELKSELWARARELKKFQKVATKTLTKGVGKYANPSDYAADMTMVFATGSHYGALQAASSNSVTLAATEGITESEILGKEVAITAGTGIGEVGVVTAYNPSTKVATVSETFTTTPAASDTYVVLDYYKPLVELPVWDHSKIVNPRETGYPDNYFPIGMTANDGFMLYPVPWRDDTQPMIVIQRYQADISETDTTGTLMLTLYQKWQTLWTAGIRWKCLQDDDDDRAGAAFQEFQKYIREIMNADIYGNTLKQAQLRVVDY